MHPRHVFRSGLLPMSAAVDGPTRTGRPSPEPLSMYTKRVYSPRDMLRWTRYETLTFLVISLVPVVLVELLGLRWLHVPWLPVSLVGTAVAFILGFQNNATYDRLWEARKIWGGVVNTSRAWGFVVCDFISDQFSPEPVPAETLGAIQQELVQRHIAWMAAFRHSMRSMREWEYFHKHRSNQEWGIRAACPEHQRTLEEDLTPHLSPDEVQQVLAHANPATALLTTQSHRLRELRLQDLIDDFRHMSMQDQLTELVALQGKSERIKNFPYPRQYATLNSFFVWIFLFMVPFAVMEQFQTLSEVVAEDYPVFGEYVFVWASVPFSMVVMWVFHTIERIGRASENPFEGTANDVPISTIARAIEIDLLQMLDGPQAQTPEPLTPERGIQF